MSQIISGARIHKIVVVSNAEVWWIIWISGGRIRCSPAGTETGAYFLPQPVNLIIRRRPIQVHVSSLEPGLATVCWPGTELWGAGI